MHPRSNSPSCCALLQMLRFIILLSNLIPISLYVTLEVVKVLQCAMTLNQDRAMYNAEFDTPFQCRTTTLNEELGQVRIMHRTATAQLSGQCLCCS